MPRRALAFLLVLLVTGGHLAGLQMLAWSGMILARSQTMGLAGAMSSSLDGSQPCCMCMAVQDMRKADQDDAGKAPPRQDARKADLALSDACPRPDVGLAAIRRLLPLADGVPDQHRPPPEPPPPRRA